MSQEILNHVSSGSVKKVPDLKPGYAVKIYQKITEGDKVRTQIFQGLVIKVSAGEGINKTFTVRKIVEGVGVEKLFPFYSPNIEKVELIKKGKVRRSKLYYMRDRSGKSARLRDQLFRDFEMMEPELEPVAEEEAETPAVEPEAQTEETPDEVTSSEETSAPVEEEPKDEKEDK
ncbi:50S ribosomal protein L19 [Patescibacteria group bacterium]|nr:50S ribosomal protein L19 [Patescibacteria group bacterium]